MPLIRVDTETGWTLAQARLLDERSGVLRLLQGEVAVVPTAPDLTASGKPGAPSTPRYVGSGAATTCLVVAVRAGGCLLMAHVEDSSSCEDLVRRAEILVDAAATGGVSNTCDVWMLGSFLDVTGRSEKLVESFEREMAESTPVIFKVQSTCILAGNTDRETGGPKFTGMAFDVLCGEAFPAVFAGSCPGTLRRHAVFWLKASATRGSLNEVWDPWSGGVLVLKSFHCAYTDQLRLFIDHALTLCDSELLEVTSTSPKYEEGTYCGEVRDTFRWLLENQNSFQPKEIFKWNELASVWERVLEREEIEMVATASTETLFSAAENR